jgi:putative MATE family efflux protein
MNILKWRPSPNIREIGSFALPVFIEQAAVAIMSLLSSLMVSHISSAAVSGVNLIDNLNVLVANFFLSIEIGTIVVIAQYCGKKDRESASETVVQSLVLGLALSFIMCITMGIFSHQVVGLILKDAEAAVYNSGYTYFICALISFPFLAIYAICTGAIRGSGYPKTSLIATIVTNVMFALLGYIFIFWFGMGVLGTGVALIVSRILGAATGLVLIRRGNENLFVPSFLPKKLRWDIQKPILTIGIPACIENVIFMVGRLITQTFTVPMGTANMASNAISNAIVSFYNIPGNTASATATPIIGKYLGQMDKKQAKKMGDLIMLLITVVFIALSVVMFIFARPIASLFSTNPEIVEKITFITRVCYVVTPIAWQFSFVLPAMLRASGDVVYTSTISIVSMFLLRVTVGYLLAIKLEFGVIGVWIGMYTDWVFRGILFSIRYLKGKWLDRKLV